MVIFRSTPHPNPNADDFPYIESAALSSLGCKSLGAMAGGGMKNNHIAPVLQNVDEPNTLVIGDSAEPKSIAELQEYGVNIIGVKKVGHKDANGTKKTFKHYMIDFVGQQKISVTKRSSNIWREYLGYLHKEDKEGKILNDPEDGNDHAMDAIGYGFMGLRPVDDEEETNLTSGNIKTLWY